MKLYSSFIFVFCFCQSGLDPKVFANNNCKRTKRNLTFTHQTIFKEEKLEKTKKTKFFKRFLFNPKIPLQTEQKTPLQKWSCQLKEKVKTET